MIKKKEINEYQLSNVVKQNVDSGFMVYEIRSEMDVSELSREVKKELKKGTVKLIRVISWDD